MYVFQKNDSKYQAWAKSLADLGIRTVAVEGSPARAVLVLLRMAFSMQPIHGYVFRYLNDYESTLKTFVRFISELSVIGIVKLLRGKVLWIAHNVDRESVCHHPRLARMRRYVVSRAAEVVFVTDPLLRKAAIERLKNTNSVDWLCFGSPPDLPLNPGTMRVERAAAALRQRLKERYPGRRVLVGLCVSSESPKCTHFLTLTSFVRACTSNGDVVGMVVVGAVGALADSRFQSAYREIRNHDQIVLIPERISVREHFLADSFEFFYRAIDDLSVSFSVYVAASVGKPLVTESDTFLANMVRHYDLGVVVDTASGQPFDLRRQLEKWKRESAQKFLDAHNWTVAARQFARAVAASAPKTASI